MSSSITLATAHTVLSKTLGMEEAKMQFEVDVFGLAQLTRLVLPDMRK